VLGDMAELGAQSQAAHREVGKAAAPILQHLFAVGERARDIADAARENGLDSIIKILDVDAAARELKHFVKSGDVVLIKASRSMQLEKVSEALKGTAKPL
jgi:UDP-N-acetylmuramoyl-tripeptide--D-alanyl-D-alanine ligase